MRYFGAERPDDAAVRRALIYVLQNGDVPADWELTLVKWRHPKTNESGDVETKKFRHGGVEDLTQFSAVIRTMIARKRGATVRETNA